MSGLFGRVFSYLMNEVAVKSLAQSEVFQRMAMRTHTGVTKTRGAVSNHVDNLSHNMKKASATANEFSTALKHEMKKDFEKFK